MTDFPNSPAGLFKHAIQLAGIQHRPQRERLEALQDFNQRLAEMAEVKMLNVGV